MQVRKHVDLMGEGKGKPVLAGKANEHRLFNVSLLFCFVGEMGAEVSKINIRFAI